MKIPSNWPYDECKTIFIPAEKIINTKKEGL
jgi:hypothetical protein